MLKSHPRWGQVGLRGDILTPASLESAFTQLSLRALKPKKPASLLQSPCPSHPVLYEFSLARSSHRAQVTVIEALGLPWLGSRTPSPYSKSTVGSKLSSDCVTWADVSPSLCHHWHFGNSIICDGVHVNIRVESENYDSSGDRAWHLKCYVCEQVQPFKK